MKVGAVALCLELAPEMEVVVVVVVVVVARLSECCGTFYSSSRPHHCFHINLMLPPLRFFVSTTLHSPLCASLPTTHSPLLPFSCSISVTPPPLPTSTSLTPPRHANANAYAYAYANAFLLITTASTHCSHDLRSHCSHPRCTWWQLGGNWTTTVGSFTNPYNCE
ncbi:hypothetical protein TSMEX_006676 [Taenia solium]